MNTLLHLILALPRTIASFMHLTAHDINLPPDVRDYRRVAKISIRGRARGGDKATPSLAMSSPLPVRVKWDCRGAKNIMFFLFILSF